MQLCVPRCRLCKRERNRTPRWLFWVLLLCMVATIAVAESHRQGGAWIELPLKERDLYIFHV